MPSSVFITPETLFGVWITGDQPPDEAAYRPELYIAFRPATAEAAFDFYSYGTRQSGHIAPFADPLFGATMRLLEKHLVSWVAEDGGAEPVTPEAIRALPPDYLRKMADYVAGREHRGVKAINATGASVAGE